MTMDPSRTFYEARFSQEAVLANRQAVFNAVLHESPFLDDENFTRFHEDDLEVMFDHYDRTCFQGRVRQQLGSTPLRFRISKRMTSAGGKTTRWVTRHAKGRDRLEYEIAVSGALLFQSFAHSTRRITVTGIPCHNRLEALQRVLEHELIHLVEMLLWSDSNCAARRFQAMAEGIFGHVEHGHRLITPRERARTQFGIRPGDQVSFLFEGNSHVGVVNRITKRATVLVEDQRGPLYSDGKRYAKFYVPVSLLQRVG